MSMREKLILIPMVVVIIVLGLYPTPVTNISAAPVNEVLNESTGTANSPDPETALIIR
jgi:NADH:ubiquinone oxidoreductase subunit 4 (subunit M)